MFVDVSGRRRRRLRWVGFSVGAVVAAYLAVVAGAMVLGVSVPYAPWPTGGAHHSNGTVQNGALHQVGNPVTPSPGTDARPSAGSGKSAAPGGASPRPSGPSPTSVPTTAAPTATATAVTVATKTKGNSASAPGHTKSPNPHGHG